MSDEAERERQRILREERERQERIAREAEQERNRERYKPDRKEK